MLLVIRIYIKPTSQYKKKFTTTVAKFDYKML